LILVVDASVAVKWFLRFRDDEAHAHQALDILTGLAEGAVRLVQPPHFIAEVAAVLAREKPDEALADLADLLELGWRQADEPLLYLDALELAIRLKHHVFDTLYHALALSIPGATLITADEAYYRKARSLGAIRLLRDFGPPSSGSGG
jgi:predicted nucleic acid-binding protein